MFERYTEQARRVVFFARWWALQAKSPKISTGHLLLGLTHEPDTKAESLFHLRERRDIFRQSIPGTLTLPNPSIMEGDLPLDNECKRVLAYSAMEAERLNSQTIDAEHLLLGLLREKESMGSKLLSKAGITLSSARQLVAGTHPSGPPGSVTPIQPERGGLSSLAYLLLLAVVIIAIYFIVRITLG